VSGGRPPDWLMHQRETDRQDDMWRGVSRSIKGNGRARSGAHGSAFGPSLSGHFPPQILTCLTRHNQRRVRGREGSAE
jgi:hypothetical protein